MIKGNFMVRLGETEKQKIRDNLKEFPFYRKSDIPGLKFLSKRYAPQKICYSGPAIDLAPVLYLESGHEYYYQELLTIIDPIMIKLESLQEEGIISELKEIIHTRDIYSYPEFSFSVGNHPKSLYIFEDSDVIEELIPEVSKVDLIYGYRSLITEEMLQNAKRGCLIFNHPGVWFKNYDISERQAKEYGLVKPRISYNQSIFKGSTLYKKK